MNKTDKKILHLTLIKKWYDAILSGEKKAEYRTNKPYWQTRLRNKHFDIIRFRNGYSKTSRQMDVECLGIIETENMFIIRLGKRI